MALDMMTGWTSSWERRANPGAMVIRVADLIGATDGDNPHIWYDPRTMPALAARLAEILKQPDNLAAFQKEMDAVTSKIAEIKSAYSGTVVTATEPVFGYMADALGFKMENYGFQLAVMNDTEMSFQQASDFEKSLHDKSMKILFYNSQVTDPVTQRMQEIAKKLGVAVIGVTETQPPGAKNYADWMLAELNQSRDRFGGKPLTPAISITNAGVRLGGFEILRGVNAEIAPGEFVGVFGPNGAGKSTLMRCILGLTPLCSGAHFSFWRTAGAGKPASSAIMPQSRASLEGTALTARSLVSAVEGGNRWGMPWNTRAARRRSRTRH